MHRGSDDRIVCVPKPFLKSNKVTLIIINKVQITLITVCSTSRNCARNTAHQSSVIQLYCCYELKTGLTDFFLLFAKRPLEICCCGEW